MALTEPQSPQQAWGSTPIPDPTVLSTAAIAAAVESLMQYIDGQLAVRDQRMDGMDTAGTLRLTVANSRVDQVADKVESHIAVAEERFKAVDGRFIDRDVAVRAALAAQKELNTQQEASNVKAIDKAEAATTETIRTHHALTQAEIEALSKSLDELKSRVTVIESVKLGGREDRSGLYAGIAIVAILISAGLGIVGLVMALSNGGGV